MRDHNLCDGSCNHAEPSEAVETQTPNRMRRAMLFGAPVAAGIAGTTLPDPSFSQSSTTDQRVLAIDSSVQQSGFLIGQTVQGAEVTIDDIAVQPDAAGRFLVGFDRDAPPQARIDVLAPDGRTASQTISVTPRQYLIRQISGLPGSTVNPPETAMPRIQRESALKQRAFASVDDRETGYLEAFQWPLATIRVTSPWGAQRSLNGSLQRPHYGVDLGAATGTPIRAPAPGIVVMAEADMFYEGGMVTLDHGQGLMTTYLHMNRIDVRVGQRLPQGTQLGHVGARGRATGPHLCWRMRWRGRHLDPTLKLAT
jgi:murein DD-endopeptidase MepM/ murein hydrolase activator NlpD